MKKLREVKENKAADERYSLEPLVILVVLALFIGLLAGIFTHDHLAHLNPGHLAWKSSLVQ